MPVGAPRPYARSMIFWVLRTLIMRQRPLPVIPVTAYIHSSVGSEFRLE